MNNVSLPSDAQLVSQYCNGNEEAFKTLLYRYKDKAFTTIFFIVRNREVAEDLLQEVFIKAVRTMRSGTYNEEGKFAPWLMRIAHNLAIDHYRRRKRHPTFNIEEGSRIFNSLAFSEESFEDGKIRKEDKAFLKELIQKLPQAQKEVLIMRHYMDMSFKEIAETTEVSINTALGRMRYALINLRKMMETKQYTYDKNHYPE
ncbi:MAG: sigma-70 family RNA polymerase sigma factor [Cytophagales bacterium]|nr:sigma-70 family RNA polymerase sigma factor [Cytophagales bacterium]